MINARDYRVKETLRSGQSVTIRAIRPEDAALIREGLPEIDQQSLYLRFFEIKSAISDQELQYFTEVDFVDHVALVVTAEINDKPIIIGGGRYFAFDHAERMRSAEVAFMVLDRYQGQGIATLIMKHLLIIAGDRGIGQFVADVLPENAKMLGVFSRTGLPMNTLRLGNVLHVNLTLSSDITDRGKAAL